MIHIARVNIGPLNNSRVIDTSGERALERTRARARNVEHGDNAVGRAHEAVKHIARIPGGSRNRPLRVDAVLDGRKSALERTCARAGSIERGDGAVWSANEAVLHGVIVKVPPCNRPRRVNVLSGSAIVRACARAGSIERSDGTVGSAHEAVQRIVRVKVRSRNRPRRIDAESGGECRARSPERGDSAVGSAHKSGTFTVSVPGFSHNQPLRVVVLRKGVLETRDVELNECVAVLILPGLS